MDQISNQIEELKSSVEDQTEAIDKTLDAASQVARAMEQLVARQRTKNRFQQLNSFVAYMLFTVLLGGGFYVLYKNRSAALTQARDEALVSAKEARTRARDMQDSQVERKRSARAAAEYYALIREDRHSEVIAGYEALSSLTLSDTEKAVFEDGLADARAQMVEAGYLAGVEAFRRNDFEAATAEFVAVMDGDGSFDPDDLLVLLADVREAVDFLRYYVADAKRRLAAPLVRAMVGADIVRTVLHGICLLRSKIITLGTRRTFIPRSWKIIRQPIDRCRG